MTVSNVLIIFIIYRALIEASKSLALDKPTLLLELCTTKPKEITTDKSMKGNRRRNRQL